MAADENFSRAMTNVITEDMEVFMEEEVGQKIIFLTPERTNFLPPGTHILDPDPASCLGL